MPGAGAAPDIASRPRLHHARLACSAAGNLLALPVTTEVMAAGAVQRPVDGAYLGRDLVRREALGVPRARIGAAGQQRLGHLDLAGAAPADRDMERCVTVAVLAVGIGPGLDQPLGGVAIVAGKGNEPLQRRQPALVYNRRIGVGAEKGPDNHGNASTVAHSGVKRCVAVPVLAVGIGAGAEQGWDGAGLGVASRSQVQRRPAPVIGDIGVGACVQQQADGDAGTQRRQSGLRQVAGEMQRRVAVPVPLIGSATSLEQQPHGLEGADRGRDVQRGAAVTVFPVGVRALGQQRLHVPGMARGLAGEQIQAAIIGGLGRDHAGSERQHQRNHQGDR